jgi:hypothetical protein
MKQRQILSEKLSHLKSSLEHFIGSLHPVWELIVGDLKQVVADAFGVTDITLIDVAIHLLQALELSSYLYLHHVFNTKCVH